MSVYFIRAGLNGPVKIGCSENVAERMKALQHANHERLYLLREAPGGQPIETWFKRAFDALRFRGEWFAFHDAMLTLQPPTGWSSPPRFEPMTEFCRHYIENQRMCGLEDRRAAHFGKVKPTPARAGGVQGGA